MKLVPIFEYIRFGESLWYLREVQVGRKTGLVLQEINIIFNCLEAFNLPITTRAAYKLEETKLKFEKLNPTFKITQEQALELVDTMKYFEATMVAESKGNIAFIVTDKRIDINRLLQNVRSLLAPDVFDSMPEIARYDFVEAGQCIAFERPTAAAFHLMRATEGVLKQLYCSLVKRERIELMWGPMVQHLRQRKNLHLGILLDHLDHIRSSFRNPTQHPDKIYDIEEVQDLFGLCVDVVNRMIAILKKQ